ncbi:MAG: hypothetical protein EA381_14990 [Planctomycetaceae bacterium]|nr:MAG: hypothetical protein EA381_14990 [Planctomycetaceae bacterium]
MVETKLLEAGFQRVDAYRYNSASLRVRIVDERFEGVDREGRDAMVETYIDSLPTNTQADIVNLVLVTPSELDAPSETFRGFMLNTEFDNPSPSML